MSSYQQKRMRRCPGFRTGKRVTRPFQRAGLCGYPIRSYRQCTSFEELWQTSDLPENLEWHLDRLAMHQVWNRQG